MTSNIALRNLQHQPSKQRVEVAPSAKNGGMLTITLSKIRNNTASGIGGVIAAMTSDANCSFPQPPNT